MVATSICSPATRPATTNGDKYCHVLSSWWNGIGSQAKLQAVYPATARFPGERHVQDSAGDSDHGQSIRGSARKQPRSRSGSSLRRSSRTLPPVGRSRRSTTRASTRPIFGSRRPCASAAPGCWALGSVQRLQPAGLAGQSREHHRGAWGISDAYGAARWPPSQVWGADQFLVRKTWKDRCHATAVLSCHPV